MDMTSTAFAPPAIETAAPAVEIATLTATSAVQAREAKQLATKAYATATADTIAAFNAAGLSTLALPQTDGSITRVTVEGTNETRTVVDFAKLATLIPAQQLADIQSASVDLAKYRAAVELGLIPAAIVAMVETETNVAQSLRITAKAAK